MPNPTSFLSVFSNADLNLHGNTAAVVLLKKLIEDDLMQQIAADFNQPATTFLWPALKNDSFQVRWFAPDAEIGLCGHGSMAAVGYLAEKHPEVSVFDLYYRTGKISGGPAGPGKAYIILDLIPVIEQLGPPSLLQEALGAKVDEYYSTGNKNIVLVGSEKEVMQMKPDFGLLRQLDTFGYAVTAPGETVDFVSRTLVPHVQQLEDPATGSSHAALTPFWARKLNKTKLSAIQLSKRGGYFECELLTSKVKLSGYYQEFASGNLRQVPLH
jgi:predicted PhzF superfamily epimerase YddE/YHI9